jgi:hypothetical protein
MSCFRTNTKITPDDSYAATSGSGGGALEDVSTVALRTPSVTSSRDEPEPSSMRDDFNTATMSGSYLVA